MKYLVFEDEFNGEEIPVIFPRNIEHATMRTLMHGIGPIASAGFVVQDDDGSVHAIGESVGLNIESRAQDSRIIRNLLKG